jgi:hypothetical protein
MKKIILLLTWIPFVAFGQEIEPIQTDRPDQTDSVFKKITLIVKP